METPTLGTTPGSGFFLLCLTSPARPAARAMGPGSRTRPNKVARDREGGRAWEQLRREGRCQERSGKDGWTAFGAEAGSGGGGCPREQMVGSAGSGQQMCQA